MPHHEGHTAARPTEAEGPTDVRSPCHPAPLDSDPGAPWSHRRTGSRRTSPASASQESARHRLRRLPGGGHVGALNAGGARCTTPQCTEEDHGGRPPGPLGSTRGATAPGRTPKRRYPSARRKGSAPVSVSEYHFVPHHGPKRRCPASSTTSSRRLPNSVVWRQNVAASGLRVIRESAAPPGLPIAGSHPE